VLGVAAADMHPITDGSQLTYKRASACPVQNASFVNDDVYNVNQKSLHVRSQPTTLAALFFM